MKRTSKTEPPLNVGEKFSNEEIHRIHEEIGRRAWRPQDFYDQFRAHNPHLCTQGNWQDNIEKVISQSAKRRIKAKQYHRAAIAKTFEWVDDEFAEFIKHGLIPKKTTQTAGTLSQPEKVPNDERLARERRWQYIQNHPLRGLKILFILKGAVGFDWFCEVLKDTRITSSRDAPSFKLGSLLSASPAPNTKDHSRVLDQPLCAFWEIYAPDPGFWVKKIDPNVSQPSVVAGFDVMVPWSMLGFQSIANLEDLALLTEFGVSIPARAYQIGVEEFEVTFLADTFSFSVRLSDHGLDALHEFSRVQHTTVKRDKLMPLGTSFTGVQLLEMFLQDFLNPKGRSSSKSRGGIAGMAGPKGRAISFFPSMPLGFTKTAESDEYSFKITVPAKVDVAARIDNLKNELKSHPTNPALYAELAAAYCHEGRLQDALQCLTTALKVAPPNAEVHQIMAEILSKVGRFPEALEHFEKASELATKTDIRMLTSSHTGIAVCLHELGKDDDALSHFEAAACLAPSNAGYQANYGMALMKVKRYTEAIICYERSLTLAPDNAASAMWLGILLDNTDRRDEAALYLEKATKLAPDSGDAHHFLGIHFATTNQHQKAVTSFQRAIEIEESARYYELLGASLADLDRWSEAEEAFRRAIKLEPNDSGIVSNLAAAVANLGRFQEAAELFEQATRINPNNTDAVQSLTKVREMIANK